MFVFFYCYNVSTIIQEINITKNLDAFLKAIRECTDLKEITPSLVNTLIKRINAHNSIKGNDRLKYVPLNFLFTAARIINITTEQKILDAIWEIHKNPLKTT